MEFQFNYQHSKRSEALETFVQQKVGLLLERYSFVPSRVHISFQHGDDTPAKEVCSIQLIGHDLDMTFSEKGHYRYDCVERAAEKMKAVLQHRREKLKDLRRTREKIAQKLAEEEQVDTPLACESF